MDERERRQKRQVKKTRRPVQSGRDGRAGAGYPEADAQRRRTSNNVNRARRNRARRRRRLFIIRGIICIILLVAVGLGFILYHKYRHSGSLFQSIGRTVRFQTAVSATITFRTIRINTNVFD